MKRCFVMYVLFSILMMFVLKSNAYAGFILTMKNGRTLSADNVKVRGDTVVISFEEGTLTFSKQEIESIKEEAVKGKAPRIEPQVARQADRGAEKTKLEVKDAKRDDSVEKNQQERSKKKAELTERLEEAKKAYFEAQGKAEKDRARERMVSISRELFGLVEGDEKGKVQSERK